MLTSMVLAAVVVALLSLIGVVLVSRNGTGIGSGRYILPLAVGVFLGVVFFELIPETLEASPAWGPLVIALGFLGFYALAYYLETYHHHHGTEEDGCMKSRGRLLLIGDAIHNFADGVVIATAFMIDPTVGVLTTIGVALHEIPQEIVEFGVLVRSGYSRGRALLLNLISASTVVVGTVVTYVFTHEIEGAVFVLTGIAAGNLLYIATADLLPQLRESHRDIFAKTFITTLIGIGAIGGVITYAHTHFMPHHDHDHEEHATQEHLSLEYRALMRLETDHHHE